MHAYITDVQRVDKVSLSSNKLIMLQLCVWAKSSLNAKCYYSISGILVVKHCTVHIPCNSLMWWALPIKDVYRQKGIEQVSVNIPFQYVLLRTRQCISPLHLIMSSYKVLLKWILWPSVGWNKSGLSLTNFTCFRNHYAEGFFNIYG